MIRVVLLLAAAALTACASTGAVPQPFPGAPTASPSAPEPAVSAPSPVASAASPSPRVGYAIAGTALSLRGIPYRLGGMDTSGFDCSGLVRYVYQQHGISVPRSVAELFRTGSPVSGSVVEPGDLVFFDTKAAGASHVGIAVGGDEFVHAPASNGVVRVERIGGTYWSARYLGTRRVTGS